MVSGWGAGGGGRTWRRQMQGGSLANRSGDFHLVVLWGGGVNPDVLAQSGSSKVT